MNTNQNSNRKTCKECGTTTGSTALPIHVRRYHDISWREYQVKHGLIPKRLCEECNKDVSFMSKHTRFCSKECRYKRQIKDSHVIFPDDSDHVECAICSLRCRQLIKHIYEVHHMSIEKYKQEYNKPVINNRLKEYKSEKFKGENNPGYNHGGKLSPWSDKSNFSHEEIKRCKQKAAKNIRENGNCSTQLSYWLKKYNGDEEKAKQSLYERQSNGLWKLQKLYGEQEGYRRWIERNERWQKSLIKSGMHSGVSKVSNSLFEKISHHVPDIKYGKNETTIRASKVYRVDCYRKSNKKVIEFFGDYWHANPKLYENSAKIADKTAKQIWQKDEYKIQDLRNKGFDVLVIWENDYNEESEKVVNQCINFLNDKVENG